MSNYLNYIIHLINSDASLPPFRIFERRSLIRPIGAMRNSKYSNYIRDAGRAGKGRGILPMYLSSVGNVTLHGGEGGGGQRGFDIYGDN